jgi:LuxR family transcriptional regulator, maltose regulon positive regulatory protein
LLLAPSVDPLERHARHHTAHAALIAQIQSLAGTGPAPPARPPPSVEQLSQGELRIMRYLPTNLAAPEIARELYVSQNTVKTHLRNLYGKLGAHRGEAVQAARGLGLLAPSGGVAKSAGPAPP